MEAVNLPSVLQGLVYMLLTAVGGMAVMHLTRIAHDIRELKETDRSVMEKVSEALLELTKVAQALSFLQQHFDAVKDDLYGKIRDINDELRTLDQNRERRNERDRSDRDRSDRDQRR